MASEKSTITRAIDSDGNILIIRVKDAYEKNILTKVEIEIVGTGKKSHLMSSEVYDFNSLTRTTILQDVNLLEPKTYPIRTFSSEEEMKAAILHKYNKKERSKKTSNFRLICHKEGCTDQNCRPMLSIGNKRSNPQNGKSPYFSSGCNATEYNESPEHLDTKFSIAKELFRAQSYFLKENKATQIKSIEIEKVFTSGNGQERRADVYYEKIYKDKNNIEHIQKFAIEVQKSNTSYQDLKVRTDWYNKNGIGVLWLVLASQFNREYVETLNKKDLTIPLLNLVSISMEINNNRFFIFDKEDGKLLSLTFDFPEMENFSSLEDDVKRKVKTKLTINNLFIVGNHFNEDDKVERLSYKENRLNKNVYSSITSISLDASFKIVDNKWDSKDKKFKLKDFTEIKKIIASTKLHDSINEPILKEQVYKIPAYEKMKVMKKNICYSQETYFNSPTRKFPPLKRSLGKS